MLQVSIAALLCGAQSLAAIAQWSRERLEDAPALLLALGLPPGRTPSVATLHRLFKTLDVAAFEQALAAWVSTTDVLAGEALAVDGKTLRGAAHAEPSSTGLPPMAHLVAVDTHEAWVVIAQVASAGKGHELTASTAGSTCSPAAPARSPRATCIAICDAPFCKAITTWVRTGTEAAKGGEGRRTKMAC